MADLCRSKRLYIAPLGDTPLFGLNGRWEISPNRRHRARCCRSQLWKADAQRLNSPAVRGFIAQRPVE
jgi:hypothetical protein